ncbi:DUF397 domain-containing protein [Streptomyces sp. NPDC087850]|uniref:DUF397 domain-containing protein n=1 Tax=Streptomyces sp. NPDC087850 TaxID=3365809 RepID=UPI00382AE827
MTPKPSPAQLAATSWRKSSYSAADNDCVEVAAGLHGWIGLRDSKAPGPAIMIPATAFTTFVANVASGTDAGQ